MYRGGDNNLVPRYHHHVPHDYFLRRPSSAQPSQPPHPSSSSQPELYRGGGSAAQTSHHVCGTLPAAATPNTTSFQHSPGCPHTGASPTPHNHHLHQHSAQIVGQSQPQLLDSFQNFPSDLCRSMGDGGHVYTDIGPRVHDLHHEGLHNPHEHHDLHHEHLEQFHRHSSPQDMGGSRTDMYRDIPHMSHGPHHHHHHHHHPHPHNQQARHSHLHQQQQQQSNGLRNLVRHTSNLDRHIVERQRPNLERRGVLEPRREYDSDDPLLEESLHHHSGDMLRHHRSVPDMYATLQAEERQQRHHQHTYGAGCRLRRQQSLSKETSMSGASAASDPPPAPPSSRRLAGLQRQHSLGQELPRSYTHDLQDLFGPNQESHQTQDLTRSQSSVQDLSRAGSVGVLGSMDIRRSRSTIQEVCRSGRGVSDEHELRHAHSTHDLPRSHSPRSPRRNTHTMSADMYPDPTLASSGGSSGPSPPLPQNLSDTEGYPRHSAHCELSRSQQLHQQQTSQQRSGPHTYYHMNVPPPPPSRVSPHRPHCTHIRQGGGRIDSCSGSPHMSQVSERSF